MAKMIFTAAELISEKGWTQDDIDREIRASKSLIRIKHLQIEQQRALVEWDDYHDKMQESKAAWDAYAATDFTGREAQTFAFDHDTMGEFRPYFINDRDGATVLAKSFVVNVSSGQFRRGDRILRVTEPTVKRSYTMLPTTIRCIEVYEKDRYGKVNVRCVIDEALAVVDSKQAAFEEKSSDERRKISQNAAAAENRKAAKALGGKALTGTPAQKKWAEDIRKQALSTMSSDVAEKLLDGKKFQAAKWWIENRGDLKKSGWLAQQAA